MIEKIFILCVGITVVAAGAGSIIEKLTCNIPHHK